MKTGRHDKRDNGKTREQEIRNRQFETTDMFSERKTRFQGGENPDLSGNLPKQNRGVPKHSPGGLTKISRESPSDKDEKDTSLGDKEI